ncbi:hypothetical protein [Luteococcus sp. OSA5]|uniref:hypothetical protein n=1 Tax=Luteococcus sp. OSA5 TaxID=3401630 RepID=UPI003B4319E1
MSLSTARRASIAALALLPAFSACSMISPKEDTAVPQSEPSVSAEKDDSDKGGSNANESNNNNSDDDSSTGSDDSDSDDRDSDSNDRDSNDSDSDNRDSNNNDSDSNDTDSNDRDSDNNDRDSDDSGFEDSGSNDTDDQESNRGSSDETDDSSSNDDSDSSGDDSDSSSKSGSETSGKGDEISVPAGSGISKLKVVDLQGAPAPGGKHAQVVGVYRVTTDRPMMLNLRVSLYDANGKMIASKTGLNSSYTTGEHDLVTSNLVTLPAGAKPKTFKVSLVDKTDMKNGFSITKMGKPQVEDYKQNKNVQALRGTATSTSAVKGSVNIKAACIKGGKIYYGTDSLSNNAREGGKVAYEIPIYDARGVDLSNADCYVSA